MILHGSVKSLVQCGGLAVGLMLAFSVAAEVSTRQGLPWDWSHRHLIYGNPDTPDEAIQKGTYDPRNFRDPRYLAAMIRKVETRAAVAAERSAASRGTAKAAVTRPAWPVIKEPTRQPPIHRDWTHVIGGASGRGNAGVFPAKYSFDISAAPSCADDFVVYPTASAGATGSGNFASRTGSWDGSGNFGNGTVVITNGTRVLTLTQSTSQNTGLFFQGNNASRVANLADAINRNGGAVGVTASFSGNVITVTSMTQGTASNSITITEGLNNFSWAGGTLTGGSGSAGQPTVLAFNQLYTTSCGGRDQPDVMWSYNTGVGAFAETSPTLSLDGTQVAFVQRVGTAASLVVLKWSASSPGGAGSPVALANTAAGSYRACTAPCMTVIPFAGGDNNTNASPYYYYESDELWVGSTSGQLHKFTGVFNGTPAAAGSPWPVTVVASRGLSSPVYDPATNLVFVGSAREPTTSTGGRLHSVNNGSGAVITSGLLAGNPLGNNGSTGVAEAPIVDSQAQRVYASVASDNSTGCSGVECQAIYQFPTNASINGLTAPSVQTGRGQIYTRINYGGVFDDAYYTSANAANPSGFLYVCGSSSPAASSRQPTLWRIPITNNVMGTPVVGPTLVSADTTDANGGCSPITDVQNGATNYIYVSVPDTGNRTGCTGSCIYSFNLSVGIWNTSKNAAAGLPAPGATSGIIIDNISGVAGASQVYYANRSNPGNAIQASQNGLN
ncbi:MAG: hypothetical protein ABIQ72_02645 [Usitatibacter sp.]